MGLVFKQQAGTAGSASSTCNAGGHDVGATAKKWDAQVDGGTAGTQYTLTVPGTDTGEDSVVLLAQWESSGPEYGNPGATVTWEAGDWICRVNVSRANRNVYWDAVEICALEGGSTTAIASASGLDTNLSSTGTYSTTITTGSPATVPLGSTIIWSFFFGQDIGTSGGQTFKVRSNKNLATPIANKAAVPVANVAPAAVVPGTTFGTISVAAPTATFASAALVPGATMGTASVSAPVAAFAASSLAPSATFGTASVAAPAATLASGAVVPGTTFGAISASVPSVSVTSASLAPGVTHSAISAAVPSVSIASANTPPRYKIDSSARPSFRAHMSINRMEASDAATSEFARSMLDACGTEAWRFGFAMSGRYRIHSMNVTAQAIAAAASGRATLADAGFDAGALMQAGASRGVQQAECVQAGSSSAGTVQRAHIESGERAA